MQSLQDRRLLAAYFLLFGVCIAILNWKWVAFSPDLSALFMASWLYHEGLYDLIYAYPDRFFGGMPPEWVPFLDQLGISNEQPLPYLYPPLWAWLFAPLAGNVSTQAFLNIVGTGMVVSFAATIPVAWRLSRSFGISQSTWMLIAIGAATLSLAGYISMMHLQIQILVTFLVVFAFERQVSGHSRSAGALLALAASLKMAPALFVILFFIERDWRALASFTVVGAVLGGLSLIVGGIDLHWAMFESMTAASSNLLVSGATVSADIAFYTLSGLLGITEALSWSDRLFVISDGLFAITLLSKAIAIAAAFWVIRSTTDLEFGKRVALRLVLLSLLLNLFGPLSWVHYYLLQVMFVPLILVMMPGARGKVFLGAFVLASSWPAILLLRLFSLGDVPTALLVITCFVAMFVSLVPKSKMGFGSRTPMAVPAE